jgi:RNA polymerase sigma factor (sigma-70 family)
MSSSIAEVLPARVSRIPSRSEESPEGRLLTAARAGDTGAYAQLVTRHQGVAFRTAYLVTGSAADAEDAAQDGFVKAWLALDRFRAGAPFRPWLLQIVVNEARNRRRAAGRRAELALRLADEPPTEPSAEATALADAERRALRDAVARLREDDQLVIGARYFLGLSEAEAATALGWRRGTVKSRLSRALGRLRAELGKAEPAHGEHAGAET